MNKKLWKSTLKSFFKNKLSVILLAIIIFISSSTFTLLENTSHSFQSSYNQVVSSGNLHDFTVKEKYSNAGNLALDVNAIDKHKSEFIPNINSKQYGKSVINQQESIYYLKQESLINLEIQTRKSSKEKWTSDATIKNLPIRANVSNLSSIAKFDSEKQQLVPKQNNETINLQVSPAGNTSDYPSLNQGLNPFIPDNWMVYPKDIQDKINKYTNIDFNSEKTVIKNQPWEKIDSHSLTDRIIQDKKDLNKQYVVHYKDSYAELKNKIIKDYNDIYKWTPVVDVKITPNASKSTKDIQKFIQKHAGLSSIVLDVVKIKTLNPDYSKIDVVAQKIKSFKNKILKQMNSSHSQEFKNDIMNEFKNQLEKPKNVQSLTILSGKKAFKIVNNGDLDSQIDKTVLFKGNNVQKPMSKKNMDAQAIKKSQEMIDKGASTTEINKTKGWKYTIVGATSLGIPLPTEVVIDKTSFECVVSPSYAKENDISPISSSVLNSKEYDEMINDLTGIKEKEFANKYSHNIIYVDHSIFIVTGIGITPDFAYPIIDAKHPIPSLKNQAIIFTNKNGYKRMLDAFRNNPQENYLAYHFKDSFKGDKNAIIAKIEKEAHKLMSWPSNIKIVSLYNDDTEHIIMAPHRISFLEKLIKTIRTVTILLVSSISLLSALMIILIIKRNISSQRKTLAILNANGYSKNQIAFSFISIGLIVVGISTILGYLVGFSLQFLFINIFRNYWTIPVFQQSFSWISFISTTLIPIVFVSILIFLVTLFALKGNVVKNLTEQDSKTTQLISTKAIKMFKFFGVKTQLAASFLFTNISKMVLIFIATAGTICATSISTTTFGKFNKAINETDSVNKYKYAVDLVSPTKEGGQYHAVIYKDPKTLKNQFKDKPTRYWAGMDNAKKRGQIVPSELGTDWKSFVHAPSLKDGASMRDGIYGWNTKLSKAKTPAEKQKIINNASTFLKNRIQFKALLNINVGMGGIFSNPWNIAKALMPSNQNAQANEDNITYLSKISDFATKEDKTKKVKEFTKIIKLINNYLKKPYDANVEKELQNELNPLINKEKYLKYLTLFSNAWNKGIRPYQIAYNQITTNLTDETYTSIKGNSTLKNIKGEITSANLSIKGINKDTNFIKSNELKKLWNSKYDKWKKGQPVPIIVNQFAKEYYNLKVGSTFIMDTKNSANRYLYKLNGIKSPKTKYKVIGVLNTYSQSEIITRHDIANKVLGLQKKEGFNGIFSHSDNPYLLTNVNLYSPSGIYPSWDTLMTDNKTSESYELVNKYLQLNHSSWDHSNPLYNIHNPDEFKRIYSKSPFLSTIEDVDWQPLSMITLKSISDLSSSLISIAESLAIAMSLIFIIIVGTMMVDDNKKNISTLKVLGYRNSEIRNAFIKSFLPSLLLSIFVAIPIVFSVLLIMKISIMSFGSVLIPLNMAGWEIITSSIMVISLFLGIFISSIYKLKGQSAIQAFKE